ncbi:hypothetical protein [Rhizobium sp. N122]|uniref:hypothetical protein n=1 Tax=Rhizobium sp. N122 TaxID=1764272 RepID=UPI001FDA207E|nr:hypothetical protein [Rhizobium sp. N122]
MTTINRTIETEHDRTMAARLIENRPVPFTLSLTDGKHRTTAQNKLQRLWMNEISQQRGDMTPEEARSYCKLTIGVPILRAENEAFRIRYDEVVKPLPYEQKLAIMAEPLDLPVTRLMTTKQKTDYLDGIVRHFAEQGIVLTMPEDMKHESGGASLPLDADEQSPSPSSAGATESPSSVAPSLADASTSEARHGDAEAEAADATAPNASAASNLSADQRAKLIEAAAKFMKLAQEQISFESRLQFLESREMDWKDAIEPANWPKLESLAAAARAVINSKRTAAQAFGFMAEVLSCGVSDIGG